MHMVYYCMGISIANGWLLYRRYCEQNNASNKRPNRFVSISIEDCKCSSTGQQEKRYPQARPPFIIITPNSPSPAKKRYSTAFPFPVEDIPFDRVGHFSVFTEKQNRCRFARVAIRTLCAPNAISNFVWSRREIAFTHFIPNKYNEQSS